jgi:peptidoglycan-associated lipoprotein
LEAGGLNVKKNVKQQTLKLSITVFTLAAVFVLGACHKKAAPPPPPPPPPAAPAPTASISVSPDTIQQGQSATLSWQTSNATDVSIDGIGAVQPSGSQSVSPGDSTTYHLVAKGAGGSQEASTRLTVTQPPPPPPAASPTDEDLFGRTVKDVYFDYDKSGIRPDQQSALQTDAQFLTQHPNISFTVEGHCDSRGSTEYNLALGDKRAAAVKDALVTMGIAANRVKTISYGKEKPFCMEENESCWQQNRRGHFVYQK